jgi:small conductance mechanosensitive channel
MLGMTPFWQHLTIAAAVIVAASLTARFADWRISRHDLPPEAVTRYRVLRRALVSGIVFVGVLSALLVIPEVRAIAGGVLASSAVIGLVVGFASQRTIGNLVAGVMIAITQPLRLGDAVEVQGVRGVVEEIGLTYTWLRTTSGDRLVVPNEKLASDTIRNSTIRSRETLAEVTAEVPLGPGLAEVLEALEADGDEAYVSGLSADRATILVRRRVASEAAVERAASDLRVALAARLGAAN